MRRIRIGGQGCNLWTPRGGPVPTPPERTQNAGWSENAARRNRQFLYSVDPSGLTGDLGFAVTLTLGATPENATDWAAIIHRFLSNLRHTGLVRYHWVTEWTRQGRPHLHASLFWPGRAEVAPLPDLYDPLRDAHPCWVGRASGPWSSWWPGISEPQARGYRGRVVGPEFRVEPWGASPRGSGWDRLSTDRVAADLIGRAWQRAARLPVSPLAQHVERIEDVAGWSSYVAKHASRGAGHYQRQRGTLPPGWQSSGRLWAKGGAWPIRSDDFEVDDRTFYRFRRSIRRWLRARIVQKLADARGKKRDQLRAELAYLRRDRRGRRGDRDRDRDRDPRSASAVEGLSTFAPLPVQQALMEWAVAHDRAEVIDPETGEVLASGFWRASSWSDVPGEAPGRPR